MEGIQRAYKEHGIGPWAIERIEDAGFLGYCSLSYHDVDGTEEMEIGYRIARDAWGQGIATEAAIAVLGYGFEILKRKRIVAFIDPPNAASMRVAEKTGMTRERLWTYKGVKVLIFAKNDG